MSLGLRLQTGIRGNKDAQQFVPADAGITSRVFSAVSGPARLHSALDIV